MILFCFSWLYSYTNINVIKSQDPSSLCYNLAMIAAKTTGKNNAFTIVEVLIVVVAIAILATIAIVAYNSAIGRTDETAMKSDLKAASDALELYKFDDPNNKYPSDISQVNITPSNDSQFEYIYDDYRNAYCLNITSPKLEGVQLYISSDEQTPTEGACEAFDAGLTSESCFAFNSSTGAITSYYNNEGNNSANPACPKDVVIPSSIGGVPVVTVGGFAMKSIQSVVIPNSVTAIGGFDHNSIKSLTIPNSVKTINGLAFFRNQISSLSLPASLTSIAGGAFNENKLPDNEAFIYARKPDGSEDKTKLVSYGGSKKSGIVIPSNVTSIELRGMYYSSISSVTIPESVVSIGDYAFAQNSLSSVTFQGNNPTSIGTNAFLHNSPLASISLPNCSTYVTSGTNRSFDATTVVYGGCAPN